MIVVLKHVMKNRPPFHLKIPLIVWNIFLALFSFLGAVRTITEFIAIYNAHGIKGTLCHNGNLYEVTGFWVILFIYSKLVEFGDTVFILLRKRPLIFLHYYHHLETCFVSFLAMAYRPLATARYFITINYSVHTLMYSYYAISPMVKPPKLIAMTITTLQTLQMFVCLAFTLGALFMNSSCTTYGLPQGMAGTNQTTLYVMLATYLIYSVMFSNYFYQSYFGAKKRTTGEQHKTKQG